MEFCRFCLKIIRDENFDITEKITLDILDVLLIEMNLNIDEKCLMCCDCQDRIERCLKFKSVCSSTEDSIVNYVSGGCKLDLEDFYLKKQKSVHIPRGHKICRLCMRISGTTKCMNNTDELIALANDILHKFIPEVKINAVKNPVICETCLLGLQSYSEFRTSCLDVEKKINRYCEATGVAKRHVRLYNVLQFTGRCDVKEYAILRNNGNLEDNKSNIEINCKEFNSTEINIKTEEIMLKSEEDIDSKSVNCNRETGLINGGQVHFSGAEQCTLYEDMNCDRNKNEIDTEKKPETLSLPRIVKEEDTDGNQLELFTKHNGEKGSEDSIMDKSVTEHDIKNEEIEIKLDVDMRDNNGEVVSEKSKRNWHCCQFCSFSTRNSMVFDRHSLIHKTPAEVIVYKCEDCSFTTKFSTGLKLHTMKMHEYPSEHEGYKCKLCPYKSIYSTKLKKHELSHLPPSERPMFKCSMCDFQSLQERYFKVHLKIHDVDSKSAWYRCTTCSYKTVHRASYKRHIHFHKLIPEAELFHCAHCPYKAKFKARLKCHLLKHRDKSEIITFNCDKCSYKAKCKRRLVVHMNTHKSPLEHEFYKCETCHYLTTRKEYLKNHILVHKDKSEVKMYRCDECAFETKYRRYIEVHKKCSHRDPSQIEMYKCEVCPFQSKRRDGLTAHLLSHKSLEEVPVYRCFHCSYQTKVKGSLVIHSQTHMDESRRHKFKCEVCGREFNYKGTLNKHKMSCVHSH